MFLFPAPPLRRAALLAVTVLLAACSPPRPATETEVLRIRAEDAPDGRPPNAEPGTCWGREITPATIETVTEQVLLQPAQIGTDGTIRAPAVYKSETRQRIVKERRELWFETPCAEDLTPEFIASVQRALAARGAYRGPVTSQLDPRTRRAIRDWQAQQGLRSDVLSMAGARKLGLVAVRTPS